MQSWINSFFKGYVVCDVKGKQIHTLINEMTKKRLEIWDIRLKENATGSLKIRLSDFFELRPLLRTTGCSIRVKRKVGIPFFLNKLNHRKVFAAGIFAFILGLYILTSLVWSIEITGNKKMPDSQIRGIAEQIGVKEGKFKFQLPPLAEIQDKMLRNLKDVSWVGVEISGTKVKIRVVENTTPEARQLENPRSLISTKDAVIYKILTEKGQPKVHINDKVKRGDVLISGLLGEEEGKKDIVVAKGTVLGRVWYTSNVTVPLWQKHKEYTGEAMNRSYLVIGNRALKLQGFGQVPFAKFESKASPTYVSWRDYRLPIYWMKEKVMEVHFYQKKLTIAEAVALGTNHAQADVMSKAGKDAEIVTQKILHQSVENGKVNLKIFYEVIEDITKEQPIVQGE